MVCNTIVVRLDPAQSRRIVEAISCNSADFLSFNKQFTEFYEITATLRIFCAGSIRATIAKQTILKTSESCRFI